MGSPLWITCPWWVGPGTCGRSHTWFLLLYSRLHSRHAKARQRITYTNTSTHNRHYALKEDTEQRQVWHRENLEGPIEAWRVIFGLWARGPPPYPENQCSKFTGRQSHFATHNHLLGDWHHHLAGWHTVAFLAADQPAKLERCQNHQQLLTSPQVGSVFYCHTTTKVS